VFGLVEISHFKVNSCYGTHVGEVGNFISVRGTIQGAGCAGMHGLLVQG
jgi:hypothetical protein